MSAPLLESYGCGNTKGTKVYYHGRSGTLNSIRSNAELQLVWCGTPEASMHSSGSSATAMAVTISSSPSRGGNLKIRRERDGEVCEPGSSRAETLEDTIMRRKGSRRPDR